MTSGVAELRADSTAPRSPEDGLPTPQRYWAMLAIWLVIATTVVDSGIANVALPVIARDLNAAPADAIWILNAYQLTVTVCLLPMAALGDKLGYRRVYIGGLLLFSVGAVFSVLAPSLHWLAASRMMQGIGAAGVMGINPAVVRFTYPLKSLGRGMGINAVVISASAAAGPTIASAVLAVASWRWLFAISAPIGLFAVVIALRSLPATAGSGRRFDTGSALLSALTLGLLIIGAEAAGRGAIGAGLIIFLAGCVAAVLLVRRESARTAPLFPVDLLRIPVFALSAVTSLAGYAAQMTAFTSLPFAFQKLYGRSVVEIGLLMTPWPVALAIAAPFSGRLADRVPTGWLSAAGLAVVAAGLTLLAIMPTPASTLDIVWRMALCGLGFGFFQTPNNRAMVTASPITRSGAAGGMLATARLFGQTTGAALVAVYFHLIPDHATRAALGTGAGLAAAAAGVSLLRLRASTDG